MLLVKFTHAVQTYLIGARGAHNEQLKHEEKSVSL